jgi:hypothetical protein
MSDAATPNADVSVPGAAEDAAVDEAVPVTVRHRFLAAGISAESFDAHLAAGRVLMAGQRVDDPDTPAPKPVDVGIGLTPAG